MELDLQRTTAKAAEAAKKASAGELERVQRQLDLTQHELEQLALLQDSKKKELDLTCEDVHTFASGVQRVENKFVASWWLVVDHLTM